MQPPINKSTSVNGNTITANATVPSYQWVDCNAAYAPIAGATTNTFTATKNGSYAVILKDANNCSDTSACVQITKIGINASGLHQGIKVYPNPAGALLTIEVSPGTLFADYRLTDALGRVVMSGTLGEGITLLNTSGLPSGIYFLSAGDSLPLRISVCH